MHFQQHTTQLYREVLKAGGNKQTAQHRDPTVQLFIAFSEDAPIGIAALYRDKDKVDLGELLQLWVSPEYRGTSVALDLMDTIFQWAKENSFSKVKAGITKANSRALKFYFKYDFSILEQTPEGVYLVKEVK